jgi:hypothetical protein
VERHGNTKLFVLRSWSEGHAIGIRAQGVDSSVTFSIAFSRHIPSELFAPMRVVFYCDN